jgi:hypothetical protein
MSVYSPPIKINLTIITIVNIAKIININPKAIPRNRSKSSLVVSFERTMTNNRNAII